MTASWLRLALAAGLVALQGWGGAAVSSAAGPGSTGGPTGPTHTPTEAPAAPLPVLLVPGWLDTERDLAALRIRLLSAGWEPGAVAAVTFADPTGSNRIHALELEQAALGLLERTGAPRLDIVAHSMGGLATRVWLREGGAGRVRRVVFAGSPHQGTWSAYLAWGEGSEEMRPGSPFLDSLNAGPPVPEGVEALTVRTPLDTHILPPESATLPGVPDVEVCCPTHTGLLRDLEVFRIIRRFLADGVVG